MSAPQKTEVPWVLRALAHVDRELDARVDVRYKAQPLAQDWARVAKLTEEAGEAIDALIRMTGQNPRKGISGTREELLEELGDTACTALLAIQHFTKDADHTWAAFEGSLEKIAARFGMEGPAPLPDAEGITGMYWDNLGSGGAA